MHTSIAIHNVVKIERKDSGILEAVGCKDYKTIRLTFTDENGEELSITVFSDDLGLGIVGVKS